MVEMVNFMLHILYHDKKQVEKEEKFTNMVVWLTRLVSEHVQLLPGHPRRFWEWYLQEPGVLQKIAGEDLVSYRWLGSPRSSFWDKDSGAGNLFRRWSQEITAWGEGKGDTERKMANKEPSVASELLLWASGSQHLQGHWEAVENTPHIISVEGEEAGIFVYQLPSITGWGCF